MANPHCRIASVRPKGGGAHIRLLLPSIPRGHMPLVEKARQVTEAMGEPQGYVIFAWDKGGRTHSGYWVPAFSRFPHHTLPTVVAEQLRSDMMSWPDVVDGLKQLGLIRPEPPEGA